LHSLPGEPLEVFDTTVTPEEVPTLLNARAPGQLERYQPNGGFKRVRLVPDTGKSAALFSTVSMYKVDPAGIELQQHQILFRDVMEDIARQSTLVLPAVTAKPAQPTELDKQAVTKTAGGAAIAGVGDLSSATLRYLTNVVMTHIVSQSIYGIFVETYTAITVAGYASKFGMDSSSLRFLSSYNAKGEKNLMAGLLRFAATMVLISGIACGILFFFLSSILANYVYHKPVYELPFKEAALLIPLIGLQLVIASGLQALKAIKWKVYTDRLIQPSSTLILLVVFYLLGLRLEALILATICGFLASTITGQFLLRKAARKQVQGVTPTYERKVWLRFALPMFFNSMIRNILNSTDILFLGALATTAQVGLYGAADRVSYFVDVPLIALNVIFSPLIAEFYARGQHKQLEQMFKLVTKWSFSLSLPVFLICLVFHDVVLGVFGANYLAASLALIVLAFGNLVDSGAGSVNYLLVMTGRPRVILANTITTIIVNITLVFFLTPRLNILGAALAAALSITILNIIGLIEVYWIMKIHPYRLDFLKPVAAGGVASLAGWLMLHFIQVGYGHFAIFGAFGLILVFLLVYGLTLAALRFSTEDRMVLEAVRSKLRAKNKK
jgi:O-antigen/teichoic acid export membrane protein